MQYLFIIFVLSDETVLYTLHIDTLFANGE